MDKYSDKYKRLDFESFPSLLKEVEMSRMFLKNAPVFLCELPNGDVGIGCTIKVNAGSNSGLLLGEPVLIGLENGTVNCDAPYVIPDRIDFPYNNFPHVNPSYTDMPRSLCLTRESIEDWYAENTFQDFIKLIRDRFIDAEKGNLIKAKAGDRYESFTHPNFDGILLYSPNEEYHLETADHSGTLFVNIKRFDLDDDKKSKLNHLTAHCSLLSYPFKDNALGLIFFREGKRTENRWFCDYPRTISELKAFIQSHNFYVEKDKLSKILLENDHIDTLYFIFPFIRPIKVVGKGSRVDYLCFATDKEDFISDKEDGQVLEIVMMDYLTPDFAKYLSNTPNSIFNKRILILGAGAIGSKLTYHLYRSGIINLTVVDKDDLLPHNLCRHAVTSATLFANKVGELKDSLSDLFCGNNLTAIKEDIMTWLPSADISKYDLIIDATASASVMRLLSNFPIDEKIIIVHFALSDAGNVGHVYIKRNRSINIPDFYWATAMKALNEDGDDISHWLKSEVGYNYESVRIGEGCHSNTMILSDDTISTHTGIASNIIRNIFEGSVKNEVYLSYTNKEYIGQVFTEHFEAPPFINIPCSMPEWSIKIPKPLYESLMIATKVSNKKETGGYLFGAIERKHKTIFILHFFIPSDSKSKKTRLGLGIKGWKDEYNRVKERTNGVLTYIGDWHSHPQGSIDMSQIDIETSNQTMESEIETTYGVWLITNANRMMAHLLTQFNI